MSLHKPPYLPLLYTLTLLPLHPAQHQPTPQAQAMQRIQSVGIAIDNTDKDAFEHNILQLLQTNFQATDAPLSLLIAFCDALVQEGREDFLTPQRKTLCTILMKRIAAQTYLQFIKQRKYVIPNTKQRALDKINNLKNITDPHREPCGHTLQNIDIILAILRMLPENNAPLQEGAQLIFQTFKAIYDQDEDAITAVFTYLKTKAQQHHAKHLIPQISTVWFLKDLILRGDRGSQAAFDHLLDLHHNTKMANVMAETTSAFVEIAMAYYSTPHNQQPIVTSKQAYTAFQQVLAATQQSKLRFGDTSKVKILAIEGLITLQYKIPQQQNILKPYLDNIKKNDQEKKRYFKNKKKHTSKIQTLFAHEKDIIALIEIIDTARHYEKDNQGTPPLAHLTQENAHQKRIIQKALQHIQATEQLLNEARTH